MSESEIRRIVNQIVPTHVQLLTYKDVVRIKEYTNDYNYAFFIKGRRTLEQTIHNASLALSRIKSLENEARARVRQLENEINRVRTEANSAIAQLNSMVSSAQQQIAQLQQKASETIDRLNQQAWESLQQVFNAYLDAIAQANALSKRMAQQIAQHANVLRNVVSSLQSRLNITADYVDGDPSPVTGKYPDDIVYSINQAKKELDWINPWNPPDAIMRVLKAFNWSVNAVWNTHYLANNLQDVIGLLNQMIAEIVAIINTVTKGLTDIINTILKTSASVPDIPTVKATPRKVSPPPAPTIHIRKPRFPGKPGAGVTVTPL